MRRRAVGRDLGLSVRMAVALVLLPLERRLAALAGIARELGKAAA